MIIFLYILVILLLILFMVLLVSIFARLGSSLRRNRRSGTPDTGAMLSWCAALLGSAGFLLLIPYALIAGRWLKSGDGNVLSVQLALFLLIVDLPLLFVLVAGMRRDAAGRGRQREKTE